MMNFKKIYCVVVMCMAVHLPMNGAEHSTPDYEPVLSRFIVHENHHGYHARNTRGRYTPSKEPGTPRTEAIMRLIFSDVEEGESPFRHLQRVDAALQECAVLSGDQESFQSLYDPITSELQRCENAYVQRTLLTLDDDVRPIIGNQVYNSRILLDRIANRVEFGAYKPVNDLNPCKGVPAAPLSEVKQMPSDTKRLYMASVSLEGQIKQCLKETIGADGDDPVIDYLREIVRTQFNDNEQACAGLDAVAKSLAVDEIWSESARATKATRARWVTALKCHFSEQEEKGKIVVKSASTPEQRVMQYVVADEAVHENNQHDVP